ncbi:hypothetical protein [Ruminococcus sp. 5_1_39BFAA]|uniref:hypothetical protein n=1 Tax=Ruminococcus sp. 5_1_39BFAA TaxID=457412 RepID=UPI003569EC19
MIIENCFCELKNKYGEAFCWNRADREKDALVDEVYSEIGQDHPLYGMKLFCLAKHESNDKVLFCTEYGQFVVIHLTYSNKNDSGYPRYKLFDTHQELKKYWEAEIQENKQV